MRTNNERETRSRPLAKTEPKIRNIISFILGSITMKSRTIRVLMTCILVGKDLSSSKHTHNQERHTTYRSLAQGRVLFLGSIVYLGVQRLSQAFIICSRSELRQINGYEESATTVPSHPATNQRCKQASLKTTKKPLAYVTYLVLLLG